MCDASSRKTAKPLSSINSQLPTSNSQPSCLFGSWELGVGSWEWGIGSLSARLGLEDAHRRTDDNPVYRVGFRESMRVPRFPCRVTPGEQGKDVLAGHGSEMLRPRVELRKWRSNTADAWG